MVDALRCAGVIETYASDAAHRLCSMQPPVNFMEIYGRSISDSAGAHRRDLNVQGLGAFDLRTLKKDGTPWNFTLRADRKLARQLINEQDPEWIIGAPPCTAFSIWNASINFKKMDPAKVKAMIEEGRLHLRFMCSLYRRQIMNGKYFLHEHPASALSWRTEEIKAIEKMALVQTIVGDQCQYGLVTPAEGDKTKMMHALKPTRFMSNSTVMLRQLGKRCDKSHEHQHLVGNRAKAAAFYPVHLVRAIIKGITLQATENAQIAAIMEETVKESMAAIPMRNVTDAKEEFGAATYS